MEQKVSQIVERKKIKHLRHMEHLCYTLNKYTPICSTIRIPLFDLFYINKSRNSDILNY